MQILKVGTRGSKLALAQAEIIVSLLKSEFTNIEFEIQIIHTSGDININSRLDLLPNYGKGVFVREIDQALLKNEVDLVVHSMKDVPTQYLDQLKIGAIPKRASPWDVLISPYSSLDELPPNAHVGTSSIRRKSELLRLRSDLNIVPLRGNVDTRIGKLKQNNLDGIILAQAALQRIEVPEVNSYSITEFREDEVVPCPGQGAIAVITKTDNHSVLNILNQIDDLETRNMVTAERSFLQEFGGGCIIPLGAVAILKNDKKEIELFAAINTPNGDISLRTSMLDLVNNAKQLGINLAHRMKTQGAKELIV